MSQKFQQVLAKNLLLKPSISHDEITFLSSCLSPRIFNLVTNWFTRRIKVNSRNNHSMSHSWIIDLKTISFGETKGNIECFLNIYIFWGRLKNIKSQVINLPHIQKAQCPLFQLSGQRTCRHHSRRKRVVRPWSSTQNISFSFRIEVCWLPWRPQLSNCQFPYLHLGKNWWVWEV